MAFFTLSDRFGDLRDLQRELDQLLGRPLGFEWVTSSGVFPPINLFNDKDGLVVRAEVAGLSADAINVNIEGRTLTLSGERKAENGTKGSYHRRERRFGKFARSVRLPDDLDTEKATAQVRDGVLTVRLPKKAAAKPKQVTVLAA
jgi:HSP20 family protein